MVRVRPSPRKKIIEIFKTEKGLSRSSIAEKLGITYWSARYHLDRLSEEKRLKRVVARIDKRRRIFYNPVPYAVYYRTQYAMMFYTETPRTESPDPIAEFRVTAVSAKKGQYNLDEFGKACVYVGVILAPQTFWIKQEIEVTAYELDEPIDVDELIYSVPVTRQLNYAERYAVFFRSRRGMEAWRETQPYWWLDPTKPLPAPRKGRDYEYDELFIKDIERKRITLRELKVKFNNNTGVMEDVEL